MNWDCLINVSIIAQKTSRLICALILPCLLSTHRGNSCNMVHDTRIIRPLPADVAAQLKSSTSIVSLSYVVLGLVENALDAEATEIAVNVDFGRAACFVEDNGIGILPTDFAEDGGLGKQYRIYNASFKS